MQSVLDLVDDELRKVWVDVVDAGWPVAPRVFALHN
jgi:hypothetical protein